MTKFRPKRDPVELVPQLQPIGPGQLTSSASPSIINPMQYANNQFQSGMTIGEGITDGVAGAASMVNPILGAGVKVLGNLISSDIASMHQDKYMSKYGSPQAQMANMRAAGVSPFAAAGNLAGVAGNSNVSATPSNFDLGSFMNNMDNALTNPLRAENLESDTGQKIANAEYQHNRVYYDNTMLEPLVKQLGISNDIQSIYRDNYTELLNLNKKELKATIDNFKELWKTYRQQIIESESKVDLNTDEASLARANARKSNTEADIEAFELACKKLGIDIDTPVGQALYKQYGLQEDGFTVEDIYDAHDRLQKAVKSGELDAINEKDPVTRSLNDISEYYNKEIAKIDAQIQQLTRSMSDNWTQKKADALDVAKKARANLVDMYHKDIRRFSQGESLNVSEGSSVKFGPVSVGQNRGHSKHN